MAFTILTTVSDYEEKERPAISGKDRGWQHEKTKQAYLAKYPWILFRGSFVAGSSHLTNLPTTAPFPTRRSTLRCPTECATSAVAPPCLSHRDAFLLKSHPIEHSCLPSFPTHAFTPNYCAEHPRSAQTAHKETGEGVLRAIFQGNLQKNLASCLHGRNN